ncbi:MAG: ribose 5-phosphate isomerase B [Candidatus Brocadiia bacterium]
MKIAFAADHGGFEIKKALVDYCAGKGIDVIDFGTNSTEACDYPDYGFAAAESVARGEAEFGVVICKSGIGMTITANKVKGIRAALCLTVEDAASARLHNHANVISLSGSRTTPAQAIDMLRVFISTQPEGGRHSRRVDKITEYEKHGDSC